MSEDDLFKELERIDHLGPDVLAYEKFALRMSAAWKRYETDCLEKNVAKEFSNPFEVWVDMFARQRRALNA